MSKQWGHGFYAGMKLQKELDDWPRIRDEWKRNNRLLWWRIYAREFVRAFIRNIRK